MTNKNTNFISFDEMESSKHTEKQGLISKLLERVKNTIIFDNPEPKDNKNYNPTTTIPEINLNVEPKRPNSRASNHSSSEAIRNLRKTVEESNTRLPENKFDLANVIPKFIYSSDNNSETSKSLDTQTDMGSKGYNKWEGRKRKDSFTTNTSSPNIDFESSKNSLQNNVEINKNSFYKNGEGSNSSSSLFNTRPTEAVTNILKRLQGQGGGINKAYWMKDEHCHECYNCSKPFSQLFRRKHHCRICGQIFCSDCASNMISGESMGHNGLIRVCDYCFTLRNSVNNQDNNQRNYDSDSCTYVINQFPNKTNHTLNNCLSKEHINEEFNSLRNINNNQLDQNIKPEGLKSLLTAGTRVANNLEFKMDNSLILPTEIIINKKITQIDDSIDNNNNNNNNNNKSDDRLRKENINEETMDEKEVKYQRLNKMINKKDNYSMITGFKDSISYNRRNEIFNEEGKFKSHSFPRKSLMNSNLTSPNARKLMRKLTISSLDSNLPSSTIKTKSLFDNHINTASLSHLKKLFNELLAEAHISQEEGWEDIIIPLVLQASFKMNLNVKGGDSMDILRYVKIKKIPGGLPINSEYIDGVVCSKNLTHKMMSRKLIRPRILIITFPFEYQRVDYQFMSIEPVIAQESEHLKNMVARVLALRPTLVIAERTISRIALDFLYKANLCVAMNVKRSVIRAIARCTQAEIISSLEQLWLEPRLGDCETFQVQTFMHEMIPTFKKSYLYFKGCKEDLGCTIILRGGTIDKLNKIKNIVRLLVNAAYSLKLETVLLRDELAKIPSPEVSNDTSIESKDINNINEKIYISSDLNPLSLDTDKLIEPFNIKILSSSPFIKFPVPYLLLKMKEEVNKIQELNEKYKCNISKEDNNNNSILKNENKQNQPEYYSEFMPDKGANALIEEHIQTFKSYHAFLNNFRPSLSPASHQSITILYCNVSLFQTIICQPPQSYTIEYYKSSDLTLGQFLELSCFDLKVLCGTCDQSVIKHSKSYVHGNARITVTVEELPSPIAGMESTILMWSYCKLCEKVLPVVPMAEETWKLSLGKYLELSFYQTNLNVRASLCPHDIHRDHVRYFGYNDLAAKFEFELIDLMEVNVPPTKLYFNHQISIDLKLKDFNNFKTKINKYWDSVSEKVKSLLMYSISAAKSETCRQDLMEMSRRVAAERSYTLQILQQTYLNSHPTDTLALNLVLRILQEKITEWDNEFTNVIQKYLQNEKDLRRLTTNQLRRLFPEREIENDNLIEREKLLKELTELENNKNIIKLKQEEEEENNLNTYFPLLGTSPKDNDILCYMANTLNDMPMELIYKPIMNPISYRRNSLKLMLEERQSKEERQSSPIPTQNPITPLPKAEKQIEDYLNLGFKKLQPKIIPMDDLGLETLSRRLVEDNNNNNNILSHKPNKVSLGGTISKNNNKQSLLNNKYSIGTLSRNVLTPKLNIPSLNNSARNSPKPPIKVMTQMNNNNNLNNNNNNNKQLQQNIIKNLKKADDSIKNKYNLKSVERRNLDKKKFNEPLEFQHKVLNNRIKRANTTATSRPSRHGKAAIEIYLNTTEAVQDESDSEEENNINEMKKPILSTLNNFDDLLSPNMETRELNLSRENQLNNNLMDNLLDFNLKPTLDLLPQNGSPNNSPPISPKDDINNQQTNLFKDENNKAVIELNNNQNNNNNNDRSSIIQTLSTFLGGVSAIGQIPLEYPIQVTEHIFPDSPIVLREDEPSSIIAFTLSTKEYFEQINLIRKSIYQNNNNKGRLTQLHELTGNNNNNNGIEDKIPMDIEKELKSQVGHHMRYQLNEGAVKLTCKIFYALQFEALRKYCDQEDLFIESLARCVKWNNSGGKSSAIFLKTRDNRLVMKEVSKAELDAFLKFAPLYFNHIGEALFEGLPVLLAKIFGIFRINIKNIHTGRSLKIDVLIMENLFYERKISRIFDLKGSFRNRHVQSTGKENEVLLDENFMEIICKSPIFIRSHSKQQLHMAIFNDTKFLSSLKVMDYSLLVGIDEENHQLIIGIVDFIRTFTWDKKLESWVKESGILGGGGELPTIVSPSNYKHRFRFNIDRYFLHVPDKFFNKKNALWIKNNRLHLP
ncbi:hypothetical protein K502DRAFT_324048 [Neoconidiobolus thromboides FSU 785]|nr:hypothetical protein K502DRAFT_324048 [Neoconidiobolus thromboides FSU 785]